MQTRMLGALTGAARVFLGTVVRVSRQVLHETTGTLFGIFAVLGATATWREWHKGSASWLVGLSLAFTLMMAAFAGASFRSARRVR